MAGLAERVEQLIAAERGPSGRRRKRLPAALKEQRTALAAELQAELRAEKPERRWTAAELLGRLKVRGARAALESALRDHHYRVRWHAARSLGELGDPAAVPALCACAQDRNAVARRAAVEALGKLGDSSVQAALCTALKDRVPQVRGAAAVALGRIGGADSVGPLVDTLRDRDPLVCRWAARSLGQFARREPRVALRVAIPVLKRRLSWWNFENKEPYRLALRRIEEATEGRKDVPLAAAPLESGAEILPLPSAAAKDKP